jgi:hypothetical protein
MKKKMSICIMAWVLLGTFASLNAQTTIQRSLYVSARGNDNNNGRSEETPYRTLGKAVETANAGVIKTITVIGTIEETRTIEIWQSGADEILITGKPDASAAERAVINTNIYIDGKVRFTHIRLKRIGGGRSITVTLGAGVIVSNPNGIGVDDVNKLIMTDDATVTGCSGIGVSNDGVNETTTVTMSGGASITNNSGGGIYTRAGTVTMSGNAKVSDNKGIGVYCVTLIMSGNAEISGNLNSRTDNIYRIDGGGAYVNNTLTMSGNARIINNTTKGCGGGAFINNGNGTISGNATISGNTAKEGGGIYLWRGYNGIFNMEGGEISGNKAENGAGVYVGLSSDSHPCTFNHKGGTITDNIAEFIGGGVYVKSRAIYNAGGGKVIGNTSGDMGDDNIFKQ